MPPAEEARAAELLERLLTDGEFRASFRRNPASACAAFDLQDLAREFGAGGKSLHTLEIRESRSSLAGALIAAASEGASGVESLRRMHDGSVLSGDAHRIVHRALTSANREAIANPSLQPGAGVHDGLLAGGGASGPGTGGATHEASAESVSAVLDSSRLNLSPEAHAALVRGGADQRLVDVLETLSRDHQLRIGMLHVSHGAGVDSLDILSVDGQRVSQSNIAARDLANELASLGPSLRPAQIVTPWPIAGDGFTTTGGHDDRIHIVFAPPGPGGPPPSVEQPVGAAPATAVPAAARIDTGTRPGTNSSPDPSTPATPPPGGGAQPSGGGTPPAEPTTPPAQPTPQPAGGAPTTPPPDPATTPASGAPTATAPPDPGTQPAGGGAAATPPPDPGTQPPAGATPPADPSPSPPEPGTQAPGGAAPPAEPPPPGTPPPSPPPVDQPSGGGTPPPDPTPPPASPPPQAGGHVADTGTPPPGPAAPSTPPPSGPPSAATPPQAVTTPAAPPPVPATPAPTAPVTPGTTPPVSPGTVPAVARQSIQLGAVAPSAQPGHGTLQFQVPQHDLSHGQAGGGQQLPGSGGTGPGAFDPNLAGALPNASDTYPGDNAGQAAIAAWMARQAHAAGLPAELPIIAALTESGLKNDNYGDRDSLGYFQMRTSIWNQGAYAGYPDHPELQLKWFIDQALAVRGKAIAGGDATFGQDRSTWGEWVADVEQPAAQYRGRYETHLDQADGLLGAGGAGAAGTVPGSAPPDPGQFSSALQAGAAQTGYSAAGLQALMIAEKYLGTPYHWGGDTPATGFDCSGLVEYSYAQLGIHIPRVAADQFNVGIPVTKDELKPGDIVFFKDSTGYVHHEGIYIGNDMFLHAPHTGDVVKISSLDETYYAQQFAGGRDVTELAGGGSPPGSAVPPESLGPPAAPGEPPASPTAPADHESGLFGAVGSSGSGGAGTAGAPPLDPAPQAPSSPPRSNTVQLLPAIEDPNA